MSLFRARGPGPATPADRPLTRLTVRLPEHTPEARVVALHAAYGEEVEPGAAVMTLRIGRARQVLAAPRRGRLLPLARPGDELLAGDALFALHLETGTAAGTDRAGRAPGASAAEPEPEPEPESRRSRRAGEHPSAAGAPARPERRAPARRRGGHAPVLRDDPAPAAPAAPAARPDRARRIPGHVAPPPRRPGADMAPPPRPRRRMRVPANGRRVLGGLLRLALALALFAAGVLFLLPVLAELGFGTSVEARLAVTLAALALGLLAWRLLARRAGWAAASGIGLLGAGWAVLVILTLVGANPLPLGPVALPDTHALAPATRTRVPPARATGARPSAFSGIRSESSAGAPSPQLAPPEERVRYSALPTERFALVPAPAAPPAVRASRSAPRPAAPAAGPVPTIPTLRAGPAPFGPAPQPPAGAGPPAGPDAAAVLAMAAAPSRPAASGAVPDLPAPPPAQAPPPAGTESPGVVRSGPGPSAATGPPLPGSRAGRPTQPPVPVAARSGPAGRRADDTRLSLGSPLSPAAFRPVEPPPAVAALGPAATPPPLPATPATAPLAVERTSSDR